MRVRFETRGRLPGASTFCCLAALVIAICGYSSVTIFAQQSKNKTEKLPAEDTRIAQQQELIGRLIGIVNELKSETDKPAAALLQSEVADVLWQFNEPAARSTFRLASDTVRDDMTIKSSSPDANSPRDSLTQSRRRISALRVILKRYGLRDRKSADAWLREFENDLKDKQTTSNNGFRISPEQAELLVDIATGMAPQDPKEAQRLGSISLSAARIPSNFGRLLMALRNRDKAFSDILFRQALSLMRSNSFLYDPSLMSLTNYAFFSSGMPFPDVSAADVGLIIQYFVDAAGAQAVRSRSGSPRSPDEQASLGSFYSFFIIGSSRSWRGTHLTERCCCKATSGK